MKTTTPPEQLKLRVNGIEIDTVIVRPKMVGGSPSSESELVIEDPKLGKFAIDDTFILEVATGRSKKWSPVTVAAFLKLLES